MHKTLILGGPGAGKTWRLLEILEAELERGVPPQEIAYVSFTRKAVAEAIERTQLKFEVNKKDLLHFKTLHALCYMKLGLTKNNVFNYKHLDELGEVLGTSFSWGGNADPFGNLKGDRALFLENYARIMQISLRQAWEYTDNDLDWYWLKLFSDSLNQYKREHYLVDFTDMLTDYKEITPVKVVIIDEAQDLSRLQWALVYRTFIKCDRMYVAGDDDQAIYKWSGADIEAFLTLPVNNVETLPFSHRLNRNVFDYTQTIADRIKYRYNKAFRPHNEHSGDVYKERYLDNIEITEDESWLFLARNKIFLKHMERHVKQQGFIYTISDEKSVKKKDMIVIKDYEEWRTKGNSLSGKKINNILKRIDPRATVDEDTFYEFKDFNIPNRIWHEVMGYMPLDDRVYYLSILRSGRKILSKPLIHINTIHSVKGSEADNVVVMSDIARRSYKNLQFDSDDENRVFYVGTTRAKNNLYVILPQTDKHYEV